MVATWGAISWRGTAADGRNKIELFTRSGNTETPDDTWSAWSAAYTQRRRLADHEPEGALPAVARGADRQGRRPGADVGHAPPTCSAICGRWSRSITVHPPGIVFQKPFTTGDPDLAGFDDQTTPDRKLSTPRRRAQALIASSLGRRTYQKGLQTLVWKADDENDDDLMYDVLYRREGETTWKTLRKAARRADSRVGHDDGAERHLLRPDRRVGRAVQSRRHRARGRTRQPGVRGRQHAAGDHGRRAARRWRKDDHHLHVTDDDSPIHASSSRSTARAGAGVPDRRHRRFEKRALRADDRGPIGDAGITIRAQRLDEQRRHDARRRDPRR